MTPEQFEIFCNFRDDFCAYCMNANRTFGDILKPLQISASVEDTPDYPIETPVVYNTALDEITEDSEILTVEGGNPLQRARRRQKRTRR